MKPITTTAKFFLVQKLRLSNSQALDYILNKRLLINGKPASLLQKIFPTDKVELDGALLKPAKDLRYILFNKHRGIECTLNKNIPDNLFDTINLPDGVVPVGRLDKESEGLLLLTNDGYLIQKVIHKENEQEKEYNVTVDKDITDVDLQNLAEGVVVLGQKTLPAKVDRIGSNAFSIILIQGLNRQIRRMCHKLGYEVTSLKRVRIVSLQLDQLNPGEYRDLTEKEAEMLNLHLNNK